MTLFNIEYRNRTFSAGFHGFNDWSFGFFHVKDPLGNHYALDVGPVWFSWGKWYE